jgi:2-keto-4-pentenoate hydratase
MQDGSVCEIATDQQLAAALLAARDGVPMMANPQLADEAQAYRVQRLVMAQLGPIGGWKVGAAGPDARPNCAPLPARGIIEAPHRFDPARFTQREVESEIFFRLCTDLPPRATPYTPDDLRAAIATCHAGIEILQSRLPDPDHATPHAILADLIQHGAYACGPAIAGWETIDFSALEITQTIQGGPTLRRRGNPAGDMIRLLVWLANEGAVWAGGLCAGQVLTCGSWTGKTHAPSAARVETHFAGTEAIYVSF